MPKRYIKVKPVTELEEVLEYKFKNKDLLRQALTHASSVSEHHPMASSRDMSTLAFVGDAALKYAVARYLIQNGQNQVTTYCAELHKGTQTVVPDIILAKIAQEKLHLEEYIVRGNGHTTPNTRMYASCFEAILGATALDCGIDQQEVIFRLVERLCSDQYKALLEPISPFRFLSAGGDNDEEEIVYVTRSLWDYMQRVASGLPPYRIELKSPERTCLQKLVLLVLWFFTIYGLLCIGWKTFEFTRV